MKTYFLITTTVLFSLFSNYGYSQKWWKKAQSAYSSTVSKTSSSYKQAKKNISETYNNTSDDIYNSISESTNKYQTITSEELKNRIAKSSNIAYSNLEEYSVKTLVLTDKVFKKSGDFLTDKYKLVPYEKKSENFYTNAMISLAKNFPIYDLESGDVVSLDSFTRDMMNDFGYENMVGNDINDDPVGTAMMLMIDSDYLYEAKLIQDPYTNDWKSINELNGNSTNEKEIIDNYNELKNSFNETSDGKIFVENFTKLNESIKKISNAENYEKKDNKFMAIYFLDLSDKNYTSAYENTDFYLHTALHQEPWFGDSKKKFDAFELVTTVKLYNSEEECIKTFNSVIISKGGEYILSHIDYSEPTLINLPLGKYFAHVFSGNDLVLTKNFAVTKKKPKEKANYDYFVLEDFGEKKTFNMSDVETDTFKKGESIKLKVKMIFERAPLPNEDIKFEIMFMSRGNTPYYDFIIHTPKDFSSNIYILEETISTKDIAGGGRYIIQVNPRENDNHLILLGNQLNVFIEM